MTYLQLLESEYSKSYRLENLGYACARVTYIATLMTEGFGLNHHSKVNVIQEVILKIHLINCIFTLNAKLYNSIYFY